MGYDNDCETVTPVGHFSIWQGLQNLLLLRQCCTVQKVVIGKIIPDYRHMYFHPGMQHEYTVSINMDIARASESGRGTNEKSSSNGE